MRRFLTVGLFVLLVALVTISIATGDAPKITNNSDSVGTTGDPFTFNVTVVDNTDPLSNLTVNVSWLHGDRSGNTTLIDTEGDYFERTITLDDSISPMNFTIWANNKSGNMSSSGPHEVTVTDNDAPSIDSITGNTVGSTGETTTVDVEFSDNIGVTTATLYYKSASAGSWSSKSILGGSAGIIIPSDSTESWYYYVTVDDAAGNGPVGDPSVDGSVYFTVAVTDDDPPRIDSSTGNTVGNTGETTTIDVTFSDNIGVTTATMYYKSASAGSWISKSILGGSAGIDIPSDSAENWYYYITVDDAAGNGPIGDPSVDGSVYYPVTVTDNIPPTSLAIITSYWHNALDNPLTITATADDNDGLNSVSLYYYFSTDNISFTGPTYFDVDSDPWAGVSWDFNFPDGTGYYRFYSIAVDNTSLTESTPKDNDTSCGYDTQAPTSEVTDIGSYWDNTNPLTIEATGSDDLSGLYYVTLYYYNSTDNITWTGPHSFDADTTPWDGIRWTFDVPSGTDQHYRFYSIATDNASNFESAPLINDTMCFYGDNNAPSIPSTPSSAQTSIMVGESVGFSTSSTDNDNDQIRYDWDWNGDGTVDTWTDYYDSGLAVSTIHKWGSVGTYQVKVRARDEHGMLSNWSSALSVTVYSGGGPGDDDDDDSGGGGDNGGNSKVPPVADANGPYTGLTYQNITFNASGSSDLDGSITNYTWDFGDKTKGYGVSPIHSYNISGLFNITLIVTDNDGITDSNKTTASITSISDDDDDSDDEPPIVDVINISDGIPIELDGKIYYLFDIDGDGEPNIFYDSASGMITTVVIRSDGTYLIDIDGDGQWDHTYKTSATTTAQVEKEPEGFFSRVSFLTLSIRVVIVVTILTIAALFKIGYLYIEEESAGKKPPVNKPKSKKRK